MTLLADIRLRLYKIQVAKLDLGTLIPELNLNPGLKDRFPNLDLKVGSPNPKIRCKSRISELEIRILINYTQKVIDSDDEEFFVLLESFKSKSRQPLEKEPTKEENYTVILDDDKKNGSDPDARIILFNQRIPKLLSSITT